MLHPETILTARYKIISPLGAGGMGEVYLARDLRLEREVAIKVLPDRLAKDERALARFEREAKALAALSHPNILSIFDFGEQEGVVFAVMELLKGETLRSRMTRSRLHCNSAVEFARSIAEGLAAAHSQGVIHRDLKPENVFLTSDGGVKILDFGLARHDKQASAEEATLLPTESNLTAEGFVIGTIPYMSPEQLRASPVDTRSDIFSFGTMLYEMLAGNRPFSGTSSADLAASILKEEPCSLEKVPDCSKLLSDAVLQCLRKNPDERFQTAREVAAALKISSQSPSQAASEFAPTAVVPARRPGVHRSLFAFVAILLAIAAGIALFLWRGKTHHSVAVLPFLNMGNDPNNEYLSDGITESIINTLTQLSDVRVMARGTVFSYKGKEIDPRKVGRDLNVETVVTGRINQKGDTLLISADMTRVSDGTQLWGKQYTRNVTDLPVVQEEISREISGQLLPHMTAEQQNALSKNYTSNSEAYQLYLRGRYHFFKNSPEDYEKARGYYEEAVAKDPTYALAYIGLSNLFGTYSLHGLEPPRDSWEKSYAWLQKAEQLDRRVVESSGSGSDYSWFYEWNWAKTEEKMKRALELNPGSAESHRFYAEFLRGMGRWEEAIAQARKAQDLDPLDLAANKSLGTVYYWAKQYDRALEQFRKTEELDPAFPDIHDAMADVFAKKRMFSDAVSETSKYLKLSGDEEGAEELLQEFKKSGYDSAMGTLYKKQLDFLIMNSEEGYISPMYYVFIYAHLNRKDDAFHWLEEAYKERSSWLVFLKTDPQFDSMRSDPRFEGMIKKIGLPL